MLPAMPAQQDGSSQMAIGVRWIEAMHGMRMAELGQEVHAL